MRAQAAQGLEAGLDHIVQECELGLGDLDPLPVTERGYRQPPLPLLVPLHVTSLSASY